MLAYSPFYRDPNIKRDFCKRCSLAQKPAVTCDLSAKSLRKKRRKLKRLEHLDEDVQIQLYCKLCGYQKNFNVNEDYKFWLENPESVAEVCVIKTEENQNKKADDLSDKTENSKKDKPNKNENKD